MAKHSLGAAHVVCHYVLQIWDTALVHVVEEDEFAR